ncbi:hypothetical protein BH18THE2_BH18THE2_06890 [soil metagenome]
MSPRNRMITEDIQTIKLRLFQAFIDKELDKVKTDPDIFILEGWDKFANKIKERVKQKRQELNHVM